MIAALRKRVHEWAWTTWWRCDERYQDGEFLQHLEEKFMCSLEDEDAPELDAANIGFLITACGHLQRLSGMTLFDHFKIGVARYLIRYYFKD